MRRFAWLLCLVLLLSGCSWRDGDPAQTTNSQPASSEGKTSLPLSSAEDYPSAETPDPAEAPEERSRPDQPASSEQAESPSSETQSAAPEKPDLQTPLSSPEREESFAETIVQGILRRVNALRAQAGANELTLDANLCATAAVKSQEMYQAGAVSHTRPDGRDFVSFFDASVYNQVGENLFYTTYTFATADEYAGQAFENWKASSGHCANMINPEYTHIGINLYGEEGNLYFTQHFANLR